MAYAHSQNLLAPAVWECRQLDNRRIAMIVDFLPGNPLDKVMHPAVYWIGRVDRQPTRIPDSDNVIYSAKLLYVLNTLGIISNYRTCSENPSFFVFGTGDRARWALFIPSRTADPTGTLVHIGIEGNDAKSGGVLQDCLKVIDFANSAIFPLDTGMEAIYADDPLSRVDLLHCNMADLHG
ncbi:hypothetical protein GX50_04830 [[Emmonsia] crescens]|uniref:Uncharacterized protein n=1 Tax=[Emmonsia] crescens TaxID=73230 RepID=A0A2B7ZFM8_9EURO|nr:hypothetical protein GX50_04830 [Emmonsia crescens]